MNDKSPSTGHTSLIQIEEMTKVYQMGDFSLEVCGGPHVCNTSELGRFRIVKEESSSAGVPSSVTRTVTG